MKRQRNIPLMYVIAFLQGMVFYAPVASLYRQARGMSLGQIALLESISFLIQLAMELPWGVAADRIGYKKTMFAGCAVFALSKLAFWRADSFMDFFWERVLLSAAIAALSGVDDSILYLSCPDRDSQKVFGRYGAFSTAGLLASAGAFSLWMAENYALAALATLVAYALAAVLALFLAEVRPPEMKRREPARAFFRLLQSTLRQRRFLLLVICWALYGQALSSVCTWLSQNQYLRCGMSGRAMGFAFILVSVASMAGVFSQPVTDRVGRSRAIPGTLALAGLACLALVFTRSAALSAGCILFLEGSFALVSPLASQVWNRQVTSADRATQLSVYAVLDEAVAAGGSLVIGRVADASLDGAFGLCAAACLACALAAAIFCRQFFERD